MPSAQWELSQQCEADSQKWFGDTHNSSIPYYALAMCGEAGEFANIVKKVERKSLDPKDPVVRKMLAMELTDVFIYVHCLAAVMGIDLGETYKQKRRENNTRFMKEREARDGQATVRR